ncbi:glycosyltransferase [Porphyrobacter sp. SLTP]|uniref:glycosyltransferase family 2 protein n=1 Tax=Porphyrobacter sp. SLTP TaxID=2683266 RepID=UPI0014123BCC|nr:glycosyltransferase family A protein [Porphyrobacter sp. SLTP]NBB23592.1 glycosyltransferase [Porphyrobacter sp. SLTP]
MTRPLVSVLIPCFNAERFVAAALDSVLAQTYHPIEIIVVNDGSTDGTGAILERYRSRGVVAIDHINAGAATARNLAFKHSRGQYILYFDADDVINSFHIEALHAVLPRSSNYIAMSQWDRFRDEPTKAVFPPRQTYMNLPGPDWLALDWISGEPMTQSGMFLIPRSLIKEVGGWNESLSLFDDFEFFARIIARSDGVRFAKDARLFYRSGLSGSLSGRKSRPAMESACRSLLLGTSYLLAIENSLKARRACANILQAFHYNFYPHFYDLRSEILSRVAELGGSDLKPSGPPGFHKLRRLVGWQMARHAQHVAEYLGINGAARRCFSFGRGH